jgi:hypothetical protein
MGNRPEGLVRKVGRRGRIIKQDTIIPHKPKKD